MSCCNNDKSSTVDNTATNKQQRHTFPDDSKGRRPSNEEEEEEPKRLLAENAPSSALEVCFVNALTALGHTDPTVWTCIVLDSDGRNDPIFPLFVQWLEDRCVVSIVGFATTRCSLVMRSSVIVLGEDSFQPT